MSKVIQRQWTADGSGFTRKERLGCDYDAYVPDALLERSFNFEGEVAASVAEAETAILQLNENATTLINTEALARILLRAEAVASSRIEGLVVGARRLLHEQVNRETEEKSTDVTATEIISNIDAMSIAVDSVRAGDPITLDQILQFHERLLEGTRLSQHGGQLRQVQNWIGGTEYNPCVAEYVPPPPEFVFELMEDLIAFSSNDVLSPVAQASIAHAQFETIHPFVDGNGRTGRALIHMILRRRGLAERVLTPVSMILATWSKAYVNGLNGYRYLGPPDADAAHDGINAWVSQFSTACVRACDDATSFEVQAKAYEDEWREKVGKVRANSATDLLLKALAGAPVVSVAGAAKLIDRTFPAANNAISKLVEAGILKQVTLGSRNRAYEAPDIITAFTDFERQLSRPVGDTKISAPNRRVPPRRK
jgi:Fic family protein